MKMFRFKPIDTWFFKEARPMEGFGGMELASIFPPSPRTLLGALRTAIGDAHHVDWSRYPEEYPELSERIGDVTGYGKLQCRGVFLIRRGETLYPLPLHIVHLEKAFAKMPIADPVECDLGNVKLPSLPSDGERRYETYETAAWVTQDDLLRVLEGDVPKTAYTLDDFVHEEPRVGIGRNLHTKTVEEGKLYMTKHIRLAHDIEVALEVEGMDDLLDEALVRLGGEGRGASIKCATTKPIPKPAMPKGEVEGVFFSLITPGLFDPLKPMGVMPTSACVWKSVREGGFDVANKRSREAKSYLPVGSTWFFERDAKSAKDFIERYHDTQIGEEQELGRGRIVCGYWTK